ncbi:MAG: hypothetical protein OXU73_01835 [Candidatus Campbellbacteria bacterium]|nr:hypothetical protein [Candidatus Campbellbacteria bacterium]
MITLLALFLIFFSTPEAVSAASFRELVEGTLLDFLSSLLQIAFSLMILFFIWNAALMVIMNPDDIQKRGALKYRIVWSLIIIAFTFSIYTAIRILQSSFGLGV